MATCPSHQEIQKFDEWLQNPYTKGLMASQDRDYVSRHDFEMLKKEAALYEQVDVAMNALPVGYRLSLHLERHESRLELLDNKGNPVLLSDKKDVSMAMQIRNALFAI